MTHKLAAKHDTPVPQSHQRNIERDTLNDTPELRFLRDEIEALLGSTTVQRASRAPLINYADDHDAVAPEELGREWLERATESEENVALPDPDSTLETVSLDELADEEDEDEREDEEEAEEAVIRDSFFDRDTEPSVDAKLVQEAVRMAGK